MKQLFHLFIAVLFLGLSACNSSPKAKEEAKKGEAAEVKVEAVAAPNALTEQEKAEGWLLMFDGEVFPDTGWQENLVHRS